MKQTPKFNRFRQRIDVVADPKGPRYNFRKDVPNDGFAEIILLLIRWLSPINDMTEVFSFSISALLCSYMAWSVITVTGGCDKSIRHGSGPVVGVTVSSTIRMECRDPGFRIPPR